MGVYDTVFVGYPNWRETCPMAVFTFLEEYDFSGKTTIPFGAYGGDGFRLSSGDIADICNNSTVLDSFSRPGKQVESAGSEVNEWLAKLNLNSSQKQRDKVARVSFDP